MIRHPIPPAWPYLLVHRTLGVLFEAPCLGCGASGCDPLCRGCIARIDPLPSRRCSCCQGSLEADGQCPLCRRGGVPFERVLAMGRYCGVLRQVIRTMKYHTRADLGHWLGSLLAEALFEVAEPGWLVVPMPSHRDRRRSRGYNQVEPLAWSLAKALGLDYDDRLLKRLDAARPSYRQDRAERWQKTQSGFAATTTRRRVLLVDDVLTSGATAWAAAQALRGAGAPAVTMAVPARAMLRGPTKRPDEHKLASKPLSG